MHWSPNVVVVQKPSEQCLECGVHCHKCANNTSVDLQQELEELRAKLAENTQQMLFMEEDFSAAKKSVEQQNIHLMDEVAKLRDSYNQLLENYQKLQKLNHTLESNLLSTVEKFEADKKVLSENISAISSQLLDAHIIICDLQEDLERYRSDCNVAVRLLQCHAPQFIEPRLETLPVDVQQRVHSYLAPLSNHNIETSSCLASNLKIVQYPLTSLTSLPQTSVVYSTIAMSSADSKYTTEFNGTLSASVIAKALTKPALKPRPGRLVVCSRCQATVGVMDRAAQSDNVPVNAADKSAQCDETASGQNGKHREKGTKVHRLHGMAVETQI